MNIDSFNNQVLTKQARHSLGTEKRKEEWIKTDTWKTIDKRKETKKINDTKSQRVKEQLQIRYSILDKGVNLRKTKADKRASIENREDEAETAAHMQNMDTLYKITIFKALAGFFFKQ